MACRTASGLTRPRPPGAQMGGEVAKPANPFPPSWAPLTADGFAAARKGLEAISDMDTAAFLQAVAPSRVLEKEAWDFDAFIDCAEAALRMDKRLGRKIDRLVPKKMSEEEFWRIYYCHVYNILHGVTPLRTTPGLTKAILLAEDDTTSNAIIAAFESDDAFMSFSRKEMEGIQARDEEDGQKLALGIAKAVEKGVIEASPPVEAVFSIDVLGKSADTVATIILERLGDGPRSGCVMVLTGLSGTGKGTTVDKLTKALPRAVAWSNGNIFRSLTLLAVTHCETEGVPFSTAALTPELLQKCVKCLSFGKFNGKFDTHIKGYGYDTYVSEVANTILKESRVSKNIPTVAEVTQGEVITFAAGAAEAMRSDGMNVLMEGRAQTLDFLRTSHRFELTLSQPILIGMRRAAQRMNGQALSKLRGEETPSSADVRSALEEALAGMA